MRDQDQKEKTGVETLLRFEGTARGRDKRSDKGRKCVVSQRSNDKERRRATKMLVGASFNFIRRGGNEQWLVYAPSKLGETQFTVLFLSSSAPYRPTPTRSP